MEQGLKEMIEEFKAEAEEFDALSDLNMMAHIENYISDLESQRNQVAEALHSVLLAAKVSRQGASMAGPELILHAQSYAIHLEGKNKDEQEHKYWEGIAPLEGLTPGSDDIPHSVALSFKGAITSSNKKWMADELTDLERAAICYHAGVPHKLENGNMKFQPCGFRRIDSSHTPFQWEVFISPANERNNHE